MSDYLIEFNNISKFFGKVIALKNVTMKLKKGEIMCLLGDNGAGKSTLIKILAGVHKPDEGEIIVEGNKTVFDGPKEAWMYAHMHAACVQLYVLHDCALALLNSSVVYGARLQ